MSPGSRRASVLDKGKKGLSAPLFVMGLRPGSSAQEAREELESNGVKIPSDYTATPSDNGNGWIFQDPNGKGDSYREMDDEADARYPDGYYRIQNPEGEYVNDAGEPLGTAGVGKAETHFPLKPTVGFEGGGEGEGLGSNELMMIDGSNSWVTDLEGLSVSNIESRHVLRIEFGESAKYVLRCEGSVVFETRTGTEIMKGTPQDQRVIGLDQIVGLEVRESSLSQDGRFEIQFDDELKFIVLPSEQFESWTLDGPNGFKAVSLAGGEIILWRATE